MAITRGLSFVWQRVFPSLSCTWSVLTCIVLEFAQKLTRPGMMPWMFDDEGNLAEDQVTFDWKAVYYRADQLGGHDPNLQEGTAQWI